MCLSTIDKKTKNWKVGYKVFDKYENRLLPLYFPIYYGFEENKWIKDHKKKLILVPRYSTDLSIKEEKYKTGFHFFKYRKDAEVYRKQHRADIIRKVKVRKLTATGTQNKCEVGVAKEMFILEGISE